MQRCAKVFKDLQVENEIYMKLQDAEQDAEGTDKRFSSREVLTAMRAAIREGGGSFAEKDIADRYEPERDRLTWAGWDIHCGHGLEVLLPDRLGGGTWQAVSFEYNGDGWYMPGQLGCLRWVCGRARERRLI